MRVFILTGGCIGDRNVYGVYSSLRKAQFASMTYEAEGHRDMGWDVEIMTMDKEVKL